MHLYYNNMKNSDIVVTTVQIAENARITPTADLQKNKLDLTTS
jgi:hypothetical protein